MKTIILDGYNVIYKVPGMRKRLKESLESARKALAFHLSGWRRRYSDAGIIIVFDGRDNEFTDFSFQKREIAGIKCIFTRSNQKADEKIISLISDSDDPRNITVVTEDNSIRNSCRAHGAEIKTIDFILPPAKRKEKGLKGADKVTPPVNTSRVTDYYEEYLRSAGKI